MRLTNPTPTEVLRALGTAAAGDIAWLLGVAPETVYPDLVAAESRGAARVRAEGDRQVAVWDSMEEPERWKPSLPITSLAAPLKAASK